MVEYLLAYANPASGEAEGRMQESRMLEDGMAHSVGVLPVSQSARPCDEQGLASSLAVVTPLRTGRIAPLLSIAEPCGK